MDIQAIATQTRLPVRKIRYVLDQRLLRGLRGRLQTHLAGRPRAFSGLEGFRIACVALFLEGGVRRQTVTEVMERLTTAPWPIVPTKDGRPRATQRTAACPQCTIEALYTQPHDPVAIQIGDGVNLRLRLGRIDTGWLEPRTLAPLSATYRPRVVIELDLAQLGTAFRAVDKGE